MSVGAISRSRFPSIRAISRSRAGLALARAACDQRKRRVPATAALRGDGGLAHTSSYNKDRYEHCRGESRSSPRSELLDATPAPGLTDRMMPLKLSQEACLATKNLPQKSDRPRAARHARATSRAPACVTMGSSRRRQIDPLSGAICRGRVPRSGCAWSRRQALAARPGQG